MSMRMHSGLTCVSLLSALGVAACSSGGSTSASHASPKIMSVRRVVAHPSWATSARLAGRVADDEPIAIQVHLQTKDTAAAAAELAAISDPDSPQYGRFLTDAEFDAKYGPSDADVAAVRAHLEASGLQVTHVPANRTFVAATGSAAQVSRAFSTRLGLYQVDSQLRRAPIDPPTVPHAIENAVLGVLGLTTPLQMKPRNVVVGGIRRDSIKAPTVAASGDAGVSPIPPNAIGGTGQCSEWFCSTPDTVDPPYAPGYPPLTYAPCGYVPSQIREAYGFTSSVRKGNDGTGVSVAVVDAYLSPTLLSDVQTYAAQNDSDYPLAASQLATYWAPGTATLPDPGWYIEQTLDVEAAHAIAPGARIVAVAAQSQSDQDLVAAVNLIIEKKLATIVSNSYETQVEAGLTDALIWEALATQAALKGIGLYFSSGDSGDDSAGFGNPTISFPGSLSTITSVGGTSLALGNLGQRLWETGWETGVSFLEYVPVVTPEPDAGAGGDSSGPVPSEGGPAPTSKAIARGALGHRADPSDASTPEAGSGAGGGSEGGGDDGASGDDDASGDDGAAADDGGRGKGSGGDAEPPPISFEEVWCPSAPGLFYFGGGGGVSILFPQPTYQQGIVPSSIANTPGVPARVVPDVSMVADPVTGFVIGTSQLTGTYQEIVIGGTSLSSPLFAGVIALAQQHAKRTLGFSNPLLYKASKSGAFVDALPLASPVAVSPAPGIVATFDFSESPGGVCGSFIEFPPEFLSIHTTVGYDDVTGLGSPNGQTFLSHVK